MDYGKSSSWLFKMIDVGGQRAERRKWLHVFTGIDVVIYVLSLSAYDQVLYEDHTTRCYDETLSLFGKTAAHKSFGATDFIVFLNKTDIFEAKLKRVPFTEYLQGFPAQQAHDAEKVVAWLRRQLEARFDGDQDSKAEETKTKIVYDQEAEEEKKEQHMHSKGKGKGAAARDRRRGLHFHRTCATDTDQIETVVKYVQIEMIRKLMARAALL